MTATREQLQQRLAAAHRTAVIIVVALTLSVVVYAGAGLLILRARGPVSQAELPYMFYGAAAALAIGSIVIRRAQLHRMRLEVVAGTRGVEGLIKHLSGATLVAAAMGEVIGMLALVVAFFGGGPSDVIRIGAVALVVSVYNYPRRAAWQRAVDYFSATLPAPSGSRLGL